MSLSSNPVISGRPEADATIQALLADLRKQPDEFFPPAEMMKIIGSPDREHYLLVIEQLFDDLYRIGRIDADSRVLDLGCGCGRMALPFLDLIDQGSYRGIDVWPEGIDWCREHLTQRNPLFRFDLLQADNNYYFDSENDQVNRFQLEQIGGDEIDFAFAISVFTHLNPEDSQSYLDEFSRVLRPGGRAYITAFIIDDEFFRFVEDTGRHKAVTKRGEGFYDAYERQHYLCGYSLARWSGMIERAGLDVLSYDVGSWARKPGARRYQDTFVVERA